MSGQLTCRICGEPRAESVRMSATHRPFTREWTLLICRNCWRTWEGLMEVGAIYIQQPMSTLGSWEQSSAFLW